MKRHAGVLSIFFRLPGSTISLFLSPSPPPPLEFKMFKKGGRLALSSRLGQD